MSTLLSNTPANNGSSDAHYPPYQLFRQTDRKSYGCWRQPWLSDPPLHHSKHRREKQGGWHRLIFNVYWIKKNVFFKWKIKYGFIGLLQFTYNMLDIRLIMYSIRLNQINLCRLFQLFLFSFVALPKINKLFIYFFIFTWNLHFGFYPLFFTVLLITNKFSIKISIKLYKI